MPYLTAAATEASPLSTIMFELWVDEVREALADEESLRGLSIPFYTM